MGQKIKFLFAAVCVGVLALTLGSFSGCGDTQQSVFVTPPDQPGAAPTVTVAIPASAAGSGEGAPVIILKNTTIIWVNTDSVDHTVSSDIGEFDSGVLRPGESFSHTFGRSGRFSFFCRIHGQDSHSGAVVVNEPEPEPGVSPTPSPSPTPTQSPSPSPTPSPTITVGIEQGASLLTADAFGENPLRVQPGTTVKWVNRDNVPHTATSTTGAWVAEVFGPGEDFEVEFDSPGNFPYFCELHPGMQGTVLVESAAP